MPRLASRGDLDALRAKLNEGRDPQRRQISICMGTGCKACGGEALLAAFETALEDAGLADEVEVVMTGCHGFCERGALLVIRPEEIFYEHVTAKQVPEIVEQTIKNGEVIETLLYAMPVVGKGRRIKRGDTCRTESEIPFYKHQERLILGLNGVIDPTRIEDYIAEGGYGALAKVLVNACRDLEAWRLQRVFDPSGIYDG